MRARMIIAVAVVVAVSLALFVAHRGELGQSRVSSPAPVKAPAPAGQTQKPAASSAGSTGPSARREPSPSRRLEAPAHLRSDRDEIAHLEDAQEITSRAALESTPEGLPAPGLADDSMAESDPDPEEITQGASQGPIL